MCGPVSFFTVPHWIPTTVLPRVSIVSFIFTLQRGKLRPREAQKVTLGHAVRRRQGGIWHQSLSSLFYPVPTNEQHFCVTVASGWGCGGGGGRMCLKWGVEAKRILYKQAWFKWFLPSISLPVNFSYFSTIASSCLPSVKSFRLCHLFGSSFPCEGAHKLRNFIM